MQLSCLVLSTESVVRALAVAAANFAMDSDLSPCSVEQELYIFVLYVFYCVLYTVSKYMGYRVFSMNKTGGMRKLFITIMPVRQFCEQVFSTFSAPSQGPVLK